MIEVYYAEDDEIIAKSVKRISGTEKLQGNHLWRDYRYKKSTDQSFACCYFAGLEYAGWSRKRIVPLDSG